MSLLSQLHAHPLACRKKQRWGRGRSHGKGGTSTKGHKGQRARAGCSIPNGFEGGQMSLVRRLPKFGFTNQRFKQVYKVWNVTDLNRFCRAGEKVEVNSGVLSKVHRRGSLVNKVQDSQKAETVTNNQQKDIKIKVVGTGHLEGALLVKVHRVTRGARKVIEAAGGTVEEIKRD